MWSIAILAILWIAGIVGAKMADTTAGKTEEELNAEAGAANQALEEKKLKLDALKAIRDSAFQRWDKRRSYEWQLSISIWTCLRRFQRPRP